VTEYRFAPGAETGRHRHGYDYVVLPLLDGNLLIERPDGTSHVTSCTRTSPTRARRSRPQRDQLQCLRFCVHRDRAAALAGGDQDDQPALRRCRLSRRYRLRSGYARLDAGAPPPANRRIRFADDRFLEFPQIRWSLSHLRELMPTVCVWRGGMRQAIWAMPSLHARPRSIRCNSTDWTAGAAAGINRCPTPIPMASFVLHRGRIVYERYFGALQPQAAARVILGHQVLCRNPCRGTGCTRRTRRVAPDAAALRVRTRHQCVR